MSTDAVVPGSGTLWKHPSVVVTVAAVAAVPGEPRNGSVAAVTALTTAVDPHSAYWQATTLEDILGTTLHLSLEGIGASLQSEDGYPVVKDVVPGGAADKDGRLQIEDKILGIEGGELEQLHERILGDR